MLLNNREIKVLLGLGNPGAKLAQTRHNIGRDFAVFLAAQEGIAFESHPTYALAPYREIALVYPTKEYMNDVGKTAEKILKDLRLTPLDLLVMHDDLETPLGKYRFKEKGSPAGHNGLKSIIDHLGTDDFLRLKIGVGRPASHDPDEVAKYVLERFSPAEKQTRDQLFRDLADTIFRSALDQVERNKAV